MYFIPCRFYIYPSNSFSNAYLSDRPQKNAITIVLVIFATALLFLIYDYLVSTREAALTSMAKSARSVVDGLFPIFVRSRLISRHEASTNVSINLFLPILPVFLVNFLQLVRYIIAKNHLVRNHLVRAAYRVESTTA